MTTGEYERMHPWPAELHLDDQAGPAAPISRAKGDALIAAALLEAGFGPAAGGELPAAAVPAPRKKRLLEGRGLWFQAAAVLAMCFVGMGSASAAVMLWKRIVAPETVIEATAQKKKAPKPRPKPRLEAKAETAEPAPKVVLDELVIEHEREKRKAPKAPEDWLEEANKLRAEKQWRDADESYAKVWQVAPKSGAAYVARVASASVRLEHLRDPKTALSRYRAALEQQPRGALLEEVRFGIAEAYRAMGQRAEEKKALELFIHTLPNSGLAKKARARLDELDQKPR